MRVLIQTVLLLLCSTSERAQTTAEALKAFVGQELILAHRGDDPKIELKTSDVTLISGDCDIAVEVKSAKWQAGTAKLKLQMIGWPTIRGQRQGLCRSLRETITLELAGFTVDESGSSLSDSLKPVLQTSEEYLASKGINFSLPAKKEREIPVNAPPPIIYPKALLSVVAYIPEASLGVIKGSVLLTVVVGSDGRLHSPEIFRGLRLGFDDHALRGLTLWRFEPAKQQDKAVAVRSGIDVPVQPNGN